MEHISLSFKGAFTRVLLWGVAEETCRPYSYPCCPAGAILLTQWMNPLLGIKAEDIRAQLDSIAEEVARELLRRHTSSSSSRDGTAEGDRAPKCSKPDLAESSSSDVLSRARELKLPARSVTDAINAVMYDQLGFTSGPVEHYYQLDNSYIDKVCTPASGSPLLVSCTKLSLLQNS